MSCLFESLQKTPLKHHTQLPAVQARGQRILVTTSALHVNSEASKLREEQQRLKQLHALKLLGLNFGQCSRVNAERLALSTSGLLDAASFSPQPLMYKTVDFRDV